MSYRGGFNDGRAQAQAEAGMDSLMNRLRRNNDSSDGERLNEWKHYAAELENKLAQAQAETLAARIQRNTYSRQIDKLVGEIRQLSPTHPSTNDVAMNGALRKEVDAQLAKHNLMIDRSNPRDHLVKPLR